jgi:hypothetical protein
MNFSGAAIVSGTTHCPDFVREMDLLGISAKKSFYHVQKNMKPCHNLLVYDKRARCAWQEILASAIRL